jgi:hypothetical protein
MKIPSTAASIIQPTILAGHISNFAASMGPPKRPPNINKSTAFHQGFQRVALVYS